MKILYLDCFSGISGDMTLGAFLDLGVKKETLLEGLKKLKVDGYKIEISTKGKNGIMGTDVDVILEEHTHEDHSHDHHDHKVHDHSHDHQEDNKSHGHVHTHDRNLHDIEALIDNSDLDEKVKQLSKDIFIKVAQAESKIHGRPIDEVHFHEVGAIDSIVDIVGAAICISALEVDKIISSPLHTGTGFVHCQHGMIPVPAPATLEILREAKVPYYSTGVPKELVTPTGAAIIATIVDEFGPMPEAEAVAIGYGTGKRDMKMANLLRMVLAETKKKHH